MSTTTTPPQRPNANNRDEWRAYWEALDQPWRTEPEIDGDRQNYLKECSIVPLLHWWGAECPFKDVVLSRADVEWLLATYREKKIQLNLSDLQEVNLSNLPLEEAHLMGAHLEGADLRGALLEGTSLSGAFFTSATDLRGIVLGNKQVGFASLAGVRWGEVDLSVVDWTQVSVLGDEQRARRRKGDDGEIKEAATSLEEYRTAVRGNRQLAVALQGQGLSEEAAHFAY